MTRPTLKAVKAKQSEEIARQTAEFEAKGGIIDKPGVTKCSDFIPGFSINKEQYDPEKQRIRAMKRWQK